ncbi:MAG: uroporphyrinogen decarboxylase family protein [Thermoguttaceae bacterium]|jgi:uroporphyrinogen decarboxylase
MSVTSKERFARILAHQPVDRVGLFEVFWQETARNWAAQGHFEKPELISDHFGLDVRRTGGEITPGDYRTVNLVADLDAREELVEETRTTRLVRDGNGAILRWSKSGSGAPEHVGFSVEDRHGWEDRIRPHLLDQRTYERRVKFDAYRDLRAKCRTDQRFMTCAVVGAFDCMSPMCGHENLLTGMASDPEWVRDMADTYATVTIRLLEALFQREGLPDGLWVWDDLGYKHKPFMSAAMYRELVYPAHRKLFDFAHGCKLPVVLHCDGFVEALIPSLIEAGIDCLQPIETKAGMDLVKLKRRYGERIALIGGMDARVLETNDLAAVRRELESKLPAAMAGSGYVLQVDHSVSSLVEYGTYRYFVEHGLEIGRYT